MNHVDVQYAGIQKYSDRVGFFKHAHTHWELFYFVAGTRQFELDDACICVGGGQWAIVKPNVPHSIPAAQSDLQIYIVKFNVSDPALYQRLLDLNACICRGDKSILSTLKKVVEEERRTLPCSQEIRGVLLEYLLYEFIRQAEAACGEQTDRVDAIAPSDGRFQNGLVNMIVRYIKIHYQEDVHIETLAKNLGYSASYCCTVFKSITQETIMDYIIRLRILSAEDMIVQNTEMPLVEISEACGFKNFSHFSKVFKQLLHITPSRVRDLARNDLYMDAKRIGFSPWLYDDKAKKPD